MQGIGACGGRNLAAVCSTPYSRRFFIPTTKEFGLVAVEPPCFQPLVHGPNAEALGPAADLSQNSVPLKRNFLSPDFWHGLGLGSAKNGKSFFEHSVYAGRGGCFRWYAGLYTGADFIRCMRCVQEACCGGKQLHRMFMGESFVPPLLCKKD